MGELLGARSPGRLRTPRLTLRQPRPQDREGLIELATSAQVRRYLGGPLDRAHVEHSLSERPLDRPGVFVVAEHTGAFVGTVTLDRRDPGRPGRSRPTAAGPPGPELEISYSLVPAFWGLGLATEAVTAVLQWAATALLDDEVLLCTQVANTRSRRLADRLGFAEVARFVEFGERQWLGARRFR